MCGLRKRKANKRGTLIMGKSETRMAVQKEHVRGKTAGTGWNGGVESHFDDVSRRKAKKSGVIGLAKYVSKLVCR